MNRNFFKGIIVVLAGMLILSNCSQRVKIGLLLDDSKTGRWIKDKEMFVSSIEEFGGQVITRASEGNPVKQLELAEELLKENIDVLVVIPSDMYAARRIVDAANAKGVKVISYDRLIKDCNLDYYISFDNVNVGELQANYITSLCPKGNYVILGGAVTDNNSFLLKLGILNVLQPLVDRGDIHIVYDNYVQSWQEKEGYREMKECLAKTTDIDAILAANDKLAGGAIRALREAGITDTIFISGQDADIEACKRVIEGTQTITIYKPIEAIAVKAAEIAMQVARDGTFPSTYLSVNNGQKQVPALLLPAMVVNKNTIDLTVVADGYLAEQQISSGNDSVEN